MWHSMLCAQAAPISSASAGSCSRTRICRQTFCKGGRSERNRSAGRSATARADRATVSSRGAFHSILFMPRIRTRRCSRHRRLEAGPSHDRRDGAGARRAASRRGDGVSRALFNRRPRAVRPAVFLRLHGARLRVDARASHIGKRAQQINRRPGVRLPRRLDRRSVRTAAADADGDRHGRFGARRPQRRAHIAGVLFLLRVQRARLRMRRAAAEPGVVVALVLACAWQGDGIRLPRDRRRRRGGAGPRVLAHTALRVACRPASDGPVDDRPGVSDGVLRA